MSPTRWREGDTIHADGSDGAEYTLCGFAYEGACMDDEHDTECVEVTRGKINCAKCLAIVRYAKSIPARYLA
jgi:hypothetical protein